MFAFRRWQRTKLLSLSLLVACVGSLLAASAAAAWGYGTVSSNSGLAYIRAAPTTNSGAVGTAWNGYRLTMYCWIDGAWAYGNYWTNRWFDVAAPPGSWQNSGFIHASLVANQPILPHC
jgi:uncharacterized protein YraI